MACDAFEIALGSFAEFCASAATSFSGSSGGFWADAPLPMSESKTAKRKMRPTKPPKRSARHSSETVTACRGSRFVAFFEGGRREA